MGLKRTSNTYDMVELMLKKHRKICIKGNNYNETMMKLLVWIPSKIDSHFLKLSCNFDVDVARFDLSLDFIMNNYIHAGSRYTTSAKSSLHSIGRRGIIPILLQTDSPFWREKSLQNFSIL